MAKKTYWEKLKDPRWQKFRLEVLSAAEFHCEYCGTGESELHVHHKEYFKGREPWEYGIKQMAALCNSCHEENHKNPDVLKLVCSLAELDGPKSRRDSALILAGFLNVEYEGVLFLAGDNDIEHFRELYKAGSDAYDKIYKLGEFKK